MARERPLIIAGTICKCLKLLGKLESNDSRTRTEHPPGGTRLPDADHATRAAPERHVSRPPGGGQRGHADRDLSDRQHRGADRSSRCRCCPASPRWCACRSRTACSGRHKQGDDRPASFEYNGVQLRAGQRPRLRRPVRGRYARVRRGDDAGAAATTARSARAWAPTSRARPRTSSRATARDCLPYVFELAGKYGIRVIAMEVTHESHVDEIRDALAATGNPTGVMLQIGTRNTQNFELLKLVGKQQRVAGAVQARLRHHARRVAERRRVPGQRRQPQGRLLPARHEDQHRRSAPQLRRLRARAGRQAADAHAGRASTRRTRSARAPARPTACSTSSTSPRRASSPAPTWCSSISIPIRRKALVDGPQALLLAELRPFLDDVAIARESYEKRTKLAREHGVAA